MDVYQRLVNYNFILGVKRTPLWKESTYKYVVKGLDHEGDAKKIFAQFVKDLNDLDQRMREEEPEGVWIIYPKMLESHINA